MNSGSDRKQGAVRARWKSGLFMVTLAFVMALILPILKPVLSWQHVALQFFTGATLGLLVGRMVRKQRRYYVPLTIAGLLGPMFFFTAMTGRGAVTYVFSLLMGVATERTMADYRLVGTPNPRQGDKGSGATP